MLVYLHVGTLIWWPENSLNIWNLLTKQAFMYKHFSNALTSKEAQNHETHVSIHYFFNKLNRSFVSGTAITLKFKLLWLPNEARY